MKNLVIANWKMHGSAGFIGRFAAEFSPPSEGCEVAVCPPFPYLAAARAALPAAVLLGAQSVSAEEEDGAYTGEVSARMLADSGCALAIIGHSERRARHQETDGDCARQVLAAARAGLRPALCIGENAETRARGLDAAIDAVLAQLEASLPDALADDDWKRLVIAYEPVWAIGSGKTPAAADIETMLNALRARLIEKSAAFGGKITLLYGGSVQPAGAREFIGIRNVNGFLVGGASLDARAFNAICNLSIPS